MKVSSGQSNIMVRMEKMFVMWKDQRKHQGLNVTFDNTKNKAMDYYNYLKEKEIGPIPKFSANTGWFYKFKTRYGFHNVKRSGEAMSADNDDAASYPDRPRAIIEEGGTSPSRFSTWMKQACSGRCLNAHTSRARSLPGLQSVQGPFHPPAGD